MSDRETEFQEDQPNVTTLDVPERLILDIEGFEGPLDVLLELARDQKVDITRVSILQLAEQYLAFVMRAREKRLELAADYLVMAAWLAYLKSRLLLPKSDNEEQPSGPEMAAALKFQLRRLEAMREAGQRLMARPQLGQRRHGRGEPDDIPVVRTTIFDVTLYDLLRAYADQRKRAKVTSLAIRPPELHSVEEAIKRLQALVGTVPDWQTLQSFLPPDLGSGIVRRSAIASTFAATLELARSGRISLRQDKTFGPIYVKGREGGR